jgi:hypothetical protein
MDQIVDLLSQEEVIDVDEGTPPPRYIPGLATY